MTNDASSPPVGLEAAAQALVEATAGPPYPFDMTIAEGRKTLDAMQHGEFPHPGVTTETLSIPAPSGEVSITLYRPTGKRGVLPVVLYSHGGGWVFGNLQTHDRLVRELTSRAEAATVFVSYSLSPEAKYPIAIEELYAALEWIAAHGSAHDLDPHRIAVAGDSAGGNMAAVITLMAKQREGPRISGKLLFYAVVDANFETPSYREFAEGYWLRRDSMQWFWNQYTDDPARRSEILASPVRATSEDLTGLPPTLIIVAEADVLRDGGEAYAAKLRAARVPVTSVRYLGIVHDFVLLNALKDTAAARAATAQGVDFLRATLWDN